MDGVSQTELELACRLQQHTQPHSLPEVSGYLVYAKTVPATWGNGDFYDIIGVRPREEAQGYLIHRSAQVDHLVMTLGDATGHGLGAALMATSFTAMLRVSIRLGVYYRDLVEALNTQLCEDFPDDHFITLLMGRLDRAKNMFRWVSFGQAPIWLYRKQTNVIENLETHHPPLGILPEMLPYAPTETFLEVGDTFLAISDGFPETMNGADQLLGEELLRSAFLENASRPPETIFQILWNVLETHAGGLPQGDDRTFLLIRREF
jgi:sigma-B regulation protein RsbU (phosphoserine phosphatase)